MKEQLFSQKMSSLRTEVKDGLNEVQQKNVRIAALEEEKQRLEMLCSRRAEMAETVARERKHQQRKDVELRISKEELFDIKVQLSANCKLREVLSAQLASEKAKNNAHQATIAQAQQKTVEAKKKLAQRIRDDERKEQKRKASRERETYLKILSPAKVKSSGRGSSGQMCQAILDDILASVVCGKSRKGEEGARGEKRKQEEGARGEKRKQEEGARGEKRKREEGASGEKRKRKEGSRVGNNQGVHLSTSAGFQQLKNLAAAQTIVPAQRYAFVLFL